MGGKEGLEHVANVADTTGLSPCILGGLMDAFKAHQDPSPRAPKTDVDGKVETSYWCIIARFLVGSPGILLGLLQSWSSKGGSADPVTALMDLLTELFSHYDSLGGPVAEKLVALGLCKLFAHPEQQLLSKMGNRLQEFIALWTTAIQSVAYDGNDSMVWGEDAAHPPTAFGDPSPEDKRRHYLDYSEPVKRWNIREAVKSAILDFTQNTGQGAFNECMGNVDKDVLVQFQDLNLFG